MGDPSAVSYSGPTYVSIRRGKHSSLTASSHAADFRQFLNLPSFKTLTRTLEDAVKPIVIFTVDGGPDENPRYGKVIAEAVKHFRENNLDAIFYATNAPGEAHSTVLNVGWLLSVASWQESCCLMTLSDHISIHEGAQLTKT